MLSYTRLYRPLDPDHLGATQSYLRTGDEDRGHTGWN